MKIFFAISSFCILFSTFTLAWDGYDWTNGSYIDVESFDHGGTGSGEVEYYDYGAGEYKYGYMELDYGGYGSGTIYDYDTGEYYDIEMD